MHSSCKINDVMCTMGIQWPGRMYALFGVAGGVAGGSQGGRRENALQHRGKPDFLSTSNVPSNQTQSANTLHRATISNHSYKEEKTLPFVDKILSKLFGEIDSGAARCQKSLSWGVLSLFPFSEGKWCRYWGGGQAPGRQHGTSPFAAGRRSWGAVRRGGPG